MNKMKTYEVCPHCGEEVMLDAELKVQTCPNCGKRIIACSMCLASETGEHYCCRCCLDYQAKAENARREEELKHQFMEVSCDYFDEASGCWLVDAYKTIHGDEESEVVAKINPTTLEVEYIKKDYAKDVLVFEAVRMKLRDILNELAVR